MQLLLSGTHVLVFHSSMARQEMVFLFVCVSMCVWFFQGAYRFCQIIWPVKHSKVTQRCANGRQKTQMKTEQCQKKKTKIKPPVSVIYGHEFEQCSAFRLNIFCSIVESMGPVISSRAESSCSVCCFQSYIIDVFV